MKKNHGSLDDIDKKILKILQTDCRIPLGNIAEELSISKSTVHYRIRRLERREIIEGYHAKVNLFKLADDFQAIILIRAKYGPEYRKKIANALSKIPGIWAIYEVLGDWDYVVLMRADNREQFIKELDSRVEGTNLIERTNTTVISRIIKESEKYFLE
jgi:DNA-binding Lrp family transcriptional regulator